MPARTPQYRPHKPTGQAVVTHSGKDSYLGRSSPATSRAEYDRLVAEWLTNGRSLPTPTNGGGSCDLSVSELLLSYIRLHGKRHPDGMGATEVVAFLDHLAVGRQVASSTQNQTLAALLLLDKIVLDRPLEWVGDDLVRARRPERLPVVLTRDEVRAVLTG